MQEIECNYCVHNGVCRFSKKHEAASWIDYDFWCKTFGACRWFRLTDDEELKVRYEIKIAEGS